MKRIAAPKPPAEVALDRLDSATTLATLRTAVKAALRAILDKQDRDELRRKDANKNAINVQ